MERVPINKEEWEKRNFTNPSDQFVIRNKNEKFFSENEDAKKHVEDVIHAATETEDVENNSLDFEQKLSPEIFEKINYVYKFVINYFQSKGFTEITDLPKTYLLPSEKNGTFGQRTAKGIMMFDMEGIEISELKQIEFLNVLAHELYHSTSKISLDYTENSPQVSVGNYGASYYRDGVAHGMALEEGLAYIFQEIAYKEIKKMFEKKYTDAYDTAIAIGVKNESNRHNISIKRAQLSRLTLTDNQGNFSFDIAYKKENDDSVVLVEYLFKEIPNFVTIIENARVRRQTLELARVIEKRFGEGSYRLVTTAKVEDAESVLKGLMSKSMPVE